MFVLEMLRLFVLRDVLPGGPCVMLGWSDTELLVARNMLVATGRYYRGIATYVELGAIRVWTF